MSPENDKVLRTKGDRKLVGSSTRNAALLAQGQKLGPFKLEELIRLLRSQSNYL